jgi:two-component system sensor histidine kinase UhpB
METAESINNNRSEVELSVIKILLIEDDPNDALLMRRMLERDDPRRFYIKHCDRLSHGIEILNSQEFDVMLLDLELPDSFGMGTIEWARTHADQLPIIVLTGMEDERIAMEALKAGAQDYLIKSRTEKTDVVKSILMALEHKQIRQELRRRERRLELAIEAAELGLWEWDILDNKIIFDQRSLNFLGLSENENSRPLESLLNVMHRDDLGKATIIVHAHIQGHSPSCEIEARIQNNSGEWRWVLILGKVVERDKDGKPSRAAGIMRDITQRKTTEKAK